MARGGYFQAASFDGFVEEPDDAYEEPGPDERCTPEVLLAWLKQLGHYPTMAECKKKFGGLLGAILDAHTLKDQGRWPEFHKARRCRE